jgi:hypothetical protein
MATSLGRRKVGALIVLAARADALLDPRDNFAFDPSARPFA